MENFLNLSVIQASNALSLLFIYALITDLVGLEAFGKIMFAGAVCGVAGSLVNYGTNQSGIKDVADQANSSGLGKVFTTVLFVRLLLLVAYFLLVTAYIYLEFKFYGFVLFSIPLVVAEVLNPLFFFIGIEKLRFFNLMNLTAKLLSIIGVIAFVDVESDAIWVNFIIGISSILVYIYTVYYLIVNYKLKLALPNSMELKLILKDNFYLTVNNLSVQLQQSMMVFALGKWGAEIVLGAYAFCDKILWGCRVLIIAVSNAAYPKGVQLYKQSAQLWDAFRFRIKTLVTAIFLIGSLIMMLFPEVIIKILTGTEDPFAIQFLRAMALVPTVAALNCFNVLDLLIKNKNLAIFRISIILLFISMFCAYNFVKNQDAVAIGYYTLIIELSAWIFYEVAIRKYKNA